MIFPKEYEVNFNQEELNRFTPTEEILENAEVEIQKQESDRRFNQDQSYKRTEEIYSNQKIDKKRTFEKLMNPAIEEDKKERKIRPTIYRIC